MTEQYTSNLKIADLTLELNPEQYEQKFIKYGTFERTISAGLIDFDINGYKLSVEINGIAQSQIEEIKKRAALKKIVDFVDFIPIAEKSPITRTVYESISSETIDSELVYLYIPQYSILITDFQQTYGGNRVTYKLLGEEA